MWLFANHWDLQHDSVSYVNDVLASHLKAAAVPVRPPAPVTNTRTGLGNATDIVCYKGDIRAIGCELGRARPR